MATLPLPARHTRHRFMRFIVVGGTAYAVQWMTMKVALPWLPTNLAFMLSWATSTAAHYSLNRFWALPSARRDSWRQLGEYLATAGVSLVIQFALFRLCLDGLGLGKLWATAIAVPPSTVIVFLLLNFRVFRHGRPTPQAVEQERQGGP